MQSPDVLTERFRARGLRVTPQRQCIFRLLEGDTAHPTAEQVYQRAKAEMPTISLKTVYQTLHELADMGELNTVDVGTGAGRFDPNVGPHHHLVCERCGTIRDVHGDFSAFRLPAGQRRGFKVNSAEVVFRGVCDECSHR